MTYKRRSNIFDPAAAGAFRLSRSKIENFMRCARCFYLDRRLGVGEPEGYPFNLNSAVDHLLKKEFDIHRAKGDAHPLMAHYKIDAVPFAHEELDRWRENFVGAQFLHKPTNLLLTGAIDDVWINPKDELHIVDYKATAKDSEVNLDAEWQIGYKRQMEIYQWIFRQNKFKVSDVGYFVYANGKRDRAAFDGKLEFDIRIIPYKGDDTWVEKKLKAARLCLMSEVIPEKGSNCQYCPYVDRSRNVLTPIKGAVSKHKKPVIKKV